MEIRDATAPDIEPIRTIARQSLHASYTFLEEETIDEAVETWYDTERLTADLDADDELLVVAVDTGEPVAFTQSELIGEASEIGQILWIHVHPDHRKSGIGPRMLVRTRRALREAGADRIRALVVADNQYGNLFYQNHGFEQVDSREVEIGSKHYIEHVYAETESGIDEADDWQALEGYDTGEETVYVSYGEAARGAEAPFYSAYEDETGNQRYGWFCGNCESLDNAMDAMGRIQCNVCGNQRKPTRWDASYL